MKLRQFKLNKKEENINNNNNLNNSLDTISKSKEINKDINFVFEKTVSSDLFKTNYYNNRACIFTSHKDDNIYIAYGIISLDLECYDVFNDKKITLIKKLHNESFDSRRYFYDEINIRDLLITSSLDRHVKVINFNKEESKLILDLNFEAEESLIINTGYFIKDKILVPFSNYKFETVKFYDMESNYIDEFKENIGFILCLNNYFWKKSNKNIVLAASVNGIYSFFFEDLSFYKKFNAGETEETIILYIEPHIFEKEDSLIVVGPSFYNGYLYFWDFNNGSLICKITLESEISDIFIYNKKYILVNQHNGFQSEFVFIDTKKNKIEKIMNAQDKDNVCGSKILKHNSKGDFLISTFMSGKLNLYINKK